MDRTLATKSWGPATTVLGARPSSVGNGLFNMVQSLYDSLLERFLEPRWSCNMHKHDAASCNYPVQSSCLHNGDGADMEIRWNTTEGASTLFFLSLNPEKKT